jgi:hypothetical protein
MKLATIILAIVLVLTGCTLPINARNVGGSTVSDVPLPNGEQGINIICFRSIAACYQTASKVCRGGSWRIIDNSRAGAMDPQIIVACGEQQTSSNKGDGG